MRCGNGQIKDEVNVVRGQEVVHGQCPDAVV